jgi:hypothetical protein
MNMLLIDKDNLQDILRRYFENTASTSLNLNERESIFGYFVLNDYLCANKE